MLIIVEGIDKSGKSTFIRHLNSATGIGAYRKYHPGLLKDDEFHSFFKGIGFALIELHNIFQFDLIIDRSFISDWVYSNRDTDKFEIAIWEEWESLVGSNSMIIIYLHIEKDTFYDRIRHQPDKYMNVDDYERYVYLYEKYINQTKIPCIRVSGEDTFQQQIERILTDIMMNERIDIAKNAEFLHKIKSIITE